MKKLIVPMIALTLSGFAQARVTESSIDSIIEALQNSEEHRVLTPGM